MKVNVVDHKFLSGASRDNFYKSSTATWTCCNRPDGDPDYTSKSGSEYWYTKDGVVRFSNHWLDVASCTWQLEDGRDDWKETAAFCSWSDFSRRVGVIHTFEAKRVYKNGNALLNNGKRVRINTNLSQLLAVGFIME